ncbi:unnamed protein product [Ectocarpus sp. CCAP 1310/34]|nr:unnamed protein product [Ectocarpus sp. CCAP 1310/34]
MRNAQGVAGGPVWLLSSFFPTKKLPICAPPKHA